jgi:hypothetical protein
LSEFFLRFGSYHPLISQLPVLFYGYNGATKVIALAINADGKLIWQVADSTVATGTLNYSQSVWHLIDTRVLIGSSGILQVKIDGIMDASYSGDTRGNGQTVIDRIIWASGSSLGQYPTHFFDDIALNDTTGGVDDSWCGDGHVEMLVPNADGDLNEWEPSSVGDHYLMVDERPPDDDTTYVGTTVGEEQEMFGLTAYDDTNKTVLRVFAEARARDMSAKGEYVKLGFKTGGTVYLSAATRQLGYNYQRVKGDEALINPYTSLAWTKTDLDALQFVIESQSDLE